MATPAAAQERAEALAVVILAAGQGTRLRSRLPKPLHMVGGRSLVGHVLRATEALAPACTVVVTGHGAAAVRSALGLEASAGRLVEAYQPQQLGTGHAVMVALPAVPVDIETMVVLYADTPLITAQTLTELVAMRRRPGTKVALVTCRTEQPLAYGRIVRDRLGRLVTIVEEKVATPEQQAINEINAGFYAFDATWLREALPRVERSPAGEYFLPDVVPLAVAAATADGPWPVATISADISESLGVNDRLQLAQAGALLRERTNRRLMLAGVTIVDPATTYIDDTVSIGPDTTIYPGTTLRGDTVIGADCRIGPGALIEDSRIADGCRVVLSVIEGSSMAAGADVGPYSHLRPGAELGPAVHIGNFAEVKNATLAEGVAMGHFGYIGDASIGAGTNIGAGTITANYGYYSRAKERTIIGEGVYIGSDTVFIPPVTVGDGAATGAGAVVNRDVAAEALVVGMPARPIRRSRPKPTEPPAN